MANSFGHSASLGNLIRTLPQVGEVVWIGIRPNRREPLRSLSEVMASPDQGLAGDHYRGSYNTKRQVTLIQAEHLTAVASFLHLPDIAPSLVRRNIAVRGINLLALKDKTFRIGEALLEMTGQCHPCSRMEEILGEGGYNAMRGHGGITARIVQGGLIRLGDPVLFEEIASL